ncbi:MAG: hypothetical protein K9J12_18370 [Melioribacteraceae bacterium]|nr:hypothetical protein [Melioribacteraceae bacterium]
MALEGLHKENLDRAISIWEKVVDGKPVNSSNFSVYTNLGTAYLLKSSTNGELNIQEGIIGIKHKLNLINSSNFDNYLSIFTDNTKSVNKSELIEHFLNELVSANGELLENLLEYENKLDSNVKRLLIERLSTQPLDRIQKKITLTKNARKNKPTNGLMIADKLYADTKSDWEKLDEIFTDDDIQFVSISDNLAKELLQCGIDFFGEFSENEKVSTNHIREVAIASSIGIKLNDKLGDAVLKVFEVAERFAIGNLATDRVQDNIVGVKEWIKNADLRMNIEPAKQYLEELDNLIEDFNRTHRNITESLFLLINAETPLKKIGNAIGAENQVYKIYSNKIAVLAQNSTVAFMRFADNQIANNQLSIFRFEEYLKKALNVFRKLKSFYKTPENVDIFNLNHQGYLRMSRELTRIQAKIPLTNNNSQSSGCYIATMVYGDYNHFKVVQLREFRDNNLSNYRIGKAFIRNYYRYSPKLVENLKTKLFINSIIKKVLDGFIWLISRK